MRAWQSILGRRPVLQFKAHPQAHHLFRAGARSQSCASVANANSSGSPQDDRLVQNTSVINKVPTSFMMTQQLYQYLLEHTREPEVLT
jgi:hypothetical protein